MNSIFTRNKILDRVFGRISWTTKPDTIYLSLLTTGPSSESGEGIVEVAGNGYARVGVAANTTNWGDQDSGNALASGRGKLYGMVNKLQVTWARATSTWGEVQHIGFHTAASGGTYLGSVPLAAPVLVAAASTFRIAAGKLRFKMGAAFTPYAADQILNWLFRGVALGEPANYHVALGTALTEAATENGAGTSDDTYAVTFTELSGGAYARRSIPNTSGRWPNAADAAKSNAGATLAFTAASGTWSEALFYALFDASTSGNAWWAGALTTPLSLVSTDVAEIAAGALVVSID